MLITNQGGAWRPPIYLLLLFLTPVFFLTACAPARYRTVPVTAAQPPPPPTEVYFYPNRGQSPAQQDRDSYECYLWAKERTGFDPSAPNLAPHHKLAVVPETPPGAGTALGAVTGAVLGAAVGSRGRGPEGALFGAMTGAMAGAIIGSSAETVQQEEASRLQRHYDRQTAQQTANIERQASQYRRAISACLEGRGYTVR